MKKLFAHNGMALPAVIFMMVIVALLVAGMARLLGAQSGINNLQLLGARAFWAAKAGGEWAAYRINATGSCASGNLVIDSFQVSVSCTSRNYLEAGNTVSIFDVNVIAQNGTDIGSVDYVSRQLDLVLNVEN